MTMGVIEPYGDLAHAGSVSVPAYSFTFTLPESDITRRVSQMVSNLITGNGPVHIRVSRHSAGSGVRVICSCSSRITLLSGVPLGGK